MFLVIFELLSIGMLIARDYLYGDGLDCVMEGIQSKQRANNKAYLATLRSFCALYGHLPNGASRNETFIHSLDYSIASEREKSYIQLDFVFFVYSCVAHLFMFLWASF